MEWNTDTTAPPTGEPRALIVIPTYNNRATLRGVVDGALATGLAVLVVNDGTSDGAAETLAGLRGYKRVDHAVNQGKGAAILTAASWAAAHGFSHLITLDGDGQHDPAEAPRFLEKIRGNPWAIVVGARQFDGAGAPWSSRFGHHFSNFWFKAVSGVGLPDTQSGYRAYPVAAVRALGCRGRHYEFEVEVLVRAAWAGLPLESIPISVRYETPGGRVTHFRPLLDNLRISKVYTQSFIRHYLPWPHRRPAGLDYADPERISLKHPLRLLKALFRERTSPRQIAAAAMLGIFLGTLPLIFCHTVVIVFCATRLRLNRLMAYSVSNLCAAPLVPVLCIEVGYFLRFERLLTEVSVKTLALQIHHRLYEYLLGSLVIGPIFAVAVGLITYAIARAYQEVVVQNAECGVKDCRLRNEENS